MSNTVLLTSALNLPALEVDALIQGKSIVAISKVFLTPGRVFALYPSQIYSPQSLNDTYRSIFLPVNEAAKGNTSYLESGINAWARCEFCQILDKNTATLKLARLTPWKAELLEKLIAQQGRIFLIHLRVYRLSRLIDFSTSLKGQFIPLENRLVGDESEPVLSEGTFKERKNQIIDFRPPLYPELEELQKAVSQVIDIYEGAKELDSELRAIMGWSSNLYVKQFDSNLDWIKTIVALGDRSIELDEGKNTYQAGTDFEQIVHKSLQFLGFQVDETHKGGAGGLDLYCSAPFPLIGECKAGKGIPGNTVKELVDLGGKHVGGSNFLDAIKLIIGPGKPTSHLIQSALQWKVSIINPMSLQKLVELKAKYPGAINLLELKKYLEPGQIDSNIDSYIEKVLQRIEVCSNLVQTVKQLMDAEPDRTQFGVVEIRTHYNAIFVPQGKIRLDETPTYEYLIELSSPLTGYLGRIEGGTGLQSDRFYFLRDLVVES